MKITLTQNKKQKPDPNNLGWGRHYTDHMFIMDYAPDKGWYDARIIPYAPLELDPACMTLHYGQGVFEGLKAYHTADGGINLFRPEMNIRRLNASNARMCIPQLDEAQAVDAIKQLVLTDKDWIPTTRGQSLYIRPFIIASDPFLGVRVSDTYMFIIILSPCANYYPEGLAPTKIHVEEEYVRAVRGGLGEAKTMGNYAASLKGQEKAKYKGFSQALWLDGIEHKYIEEVGSMNVFFVLGDKVVTPSLAGSILPGITRASIIELLRGKGYEVEERRISIDELVDAYKSGKLTEAFGTGTAAVISPVGELMYKGEHMIIGDNKIGKLSAMLYDTLTGLQYGDIEDTFGWVTNIG